MGDEIGGMVSPRWEKVRAVIRSAHEAGLKVTPSTPTIFGYPEAVCRHCGHENCPAECFWGLCDVNCVPKKAFFAARDTIRRLYS